MAKPATSSSTSAKIKPVQVPVKGARKMAVLGDFDDAVRWLMERTDIERMSPSRLLADTLKLDRMVSLMSLLGDPHRAFKSIHIAGTKGKGSTCEMTAAGLEGCGYTVGLFTSPHLQDIRERIRLNRSPIAPEVFLEAAKRVAEAEAGLDAAEGEPTFFELITAMAFVYFAEQAVDAAVIEVGLGGRLDSTNVIVPEVSAITNISLDHTQILGSTVEKIAKEKAGIFKPGVPAVSVPQTPGVVAVLQEEARKVNAPLEVLGLEIEWAGRFEAPVKGAAGAGMRVSLTGRKHMYEHVPVPLRGEHQAENCALALAVLDRLAERGFRTPEDKVTRGITTVEMPGRMELVRGTTGAARVLLDGAHNAHSVRCLMKGISAQVPYDSLVVIFGCASDKDIEGMLRELAQGADKVVFTRSASPRAADPRELARKYTESCGKISQAAPDAAAAMDLARRAAGREDLICVTGSLYLVADVRGLLGLK